MRLPLVALTRARRKGSETLNSSLLSFCWFVEPLLLSVRWPRGNIKALRGARKAHAAEEITLLADADMCISFAANRVAEPSRLVGRDAPVGFVDQPRPGQGMIDGGNVVVQQIRGGLVEIDALLDDGLVVFVQRDAAGVEDAWTLHAAGLNHERVIAAVAVLIEPLADGITQKPGLQRHVGRIVASICIDVAIEVGVTRHQNVSDVWRAQK